MCTSLYTFMFFSVMHTVSEKFYLFIFCFTFDETEILSKALSVFIYHTRLNESLIILSAYLSMYLSIYLSILML